MIRIALPLCAALVALSDVSPAAAQSCDGWKARYERARDDARAFERRYEWAQGEMRKCQNAQASAPGPDVNMRRVAKGTAKDANRRKVKAASLNQMAKAATGQGGSGGGGGLAFAIPPNVQKIEVQLLDIPAPPSGTVEYRWLEQLHASQGTFMQAWLGAAQFAEYRSVEQQTCSGKGLRCEALLRQFVLEDVAGQ